MWWEQITGYIDIIFHQNVDVIMDQGIEYLDAYTIYHIKSDKIWALGSKVPHEIMRRQRGQGIERCRFARIIEAIRQNVATHKKCNPQ